jgi:pimeloyl-ACP methyl ester carboxylesterase
MRTLKRLFHVMVVLSLHAACSESGDFIQGEMPQPDDTQEAAHTRMGLGLDQDRYITMKSTGLRIHYRIIGKGPIDIVFIPGWTNPLEIFSKQFDYFRDKARCIYIDVPGQGLSDAPEGIEYTMGLMADAVYEVIKKEGLHKFVGAAFSMGPRVLGQFELKHPGMISKIVNLDGGFDPWPPEGDPNREAYIAELEGFCAWMATWGAAEWDMILPQLVPDTAPDDLKAFVQYVYDYPSWLTANIYWNLNQENVNQPIGWSYPILSIYSVLPGNMEYQELCFPNADIHVMEGSGHVVQWERADEVNALIDDFVSDRPGKKY